MPHDLETAKYVSFTSYKRDGSAVSLPVWVVPFEDGYAFTTDADSYKVKRVTRDPRATLRVCDMRGRVADGAVEHVGAAVVLHGAATDPIVALLKKKYVIGWKMLGVMALAKKIMRKGSTASAETAIKVVLHK